VIATAVEQAFDYLDAPPARLALPDAPIAYSRPLEQFVPPQVDGIVVAWFARPGALLAAGELIAQVRVEKTSAQVHAPAAGRLANGGR